MRKHPIIYPYLFALYPIISLLSSNITQLEGKLALRPMFLSILSCVLMLILGYFIFKDWDKSSLLTSLILTLFFSYGHIYLAVEGKEIGLFVIGRHLLLIPVWIFIFGAGLIFIWRLKKDASKWRLNLNIAAIILFSMPAISLFWINISQIITPNQNQIIDSNKNSTIDQSSPDIYYIILDSYARDDVLNKMYDYDNSSFLDELEKMGFVVAHNAQANYPNTALSLSSSLNMGYLEDFSGPHNPSSTNLTPLYDRIKNNLVFQLFKQMGYTTVTFETGFSGTEIKKSDLYLKPPEQDSGLFSPPSLFEGLLIQTSALRIIIEFSSFFPEMIKPNLAATFNNHRERILYDFEMLASLPKTDGPKFVFLHMVSPHPPFVFGPNGVPINPPSNFTFEVQGQFSDRSSFINSYVNQLKYLNNRLLDGIDNIQKNSEIPPIIILQSDHGPGASAIGNEETSLSYIDERFSILNVFYLPNCGENQIYSSISPVNTFRFILTNCFSSDYELLPDRSFLSDYQTPFDLKEIDYIKPSN